MFKYLNNKQNHDFVPMSFILNFIPENRTRSNAETKFNISR